MGNRKRKYKGLIKRKTKKNAISEGSASQRSKSNVIPEEEEEEEEYAISSDDGDFVEEEMRSGRLSFLSRLSPDALLAPNRKKQKTVQEKEVDIEMVPRQPTWDNQRENEEDLHYLLPLKNKKGLIHQDPVRLEKSEPVEINQCNKASSDPSDIEDDDLEDDSFESTSPSVELTAAQILMMREKKLMSRKGKIADLSSRILEDPQTNVSYLNKLRRICQEPCPEVAITVRKLAMLSLLTIYKDIVPGYPIRELTAAENAIKVSKDVRRLRDYEQTLLSSYKQYINLLEEHVKVALSEENTIVSQRREDLVEIEINPSSSLTGKQGVAEVAVQCLCELATSLGHFNFHGDIFKLLVQWMPLSGGVLGEKVSKISCDAIGSIFRSDMVGNLSLEIVQLMTKMIKSRGYSVPNEVIKTFLCLQLQSVEEPVNQMGGVSSDMAKEEKIKKKKEIKRMTRKQRRRLSLKNRIERELKETEAEERTERKTKLQTECIKLVFFVYFRILKFNQCSPLLLDVLEGLAKFSHLISVDYFSDLMTVLQQLMEKKTLSSRSTLQCILTCLEILSGQGEALNIDPRTFYSQLYTNLLHLDYYSDSKDVALVIECLEKMIKKRRQVSVQRVCSFIKRLASVSLQLSSDVALAVMATTRLFMQSHPHQSEVLLDCEDTPSGIFRPEVPDPELSGAQSSLLWELTMLLNHYDPHVASYSHHLIKGAPSQGPGSLNSAYSRRSPLELLADHSWPNVDPFVGIPPKPRKKLKMEEGLDTSSSVSSETTRYIQTMAYRADSFVEQVLVDH